MASHFRLIDLKKILKFIKLNSLGQKAELSDRFREWVQAQKKFDPELLFKVREAFSTCPTAGSLGQETNGFRPLGSNAVGQGSGMNRTQYSAAPTMYNQNQRTGVPVVTNPQLSTGSGIQYVGSTGPTNPRSRQVGVARNAQTQNFSTAPSGECCSKEESDMLLKTDYIHNPFFTQRYFITKPKPLVPASRSSSKRSAQFSIRIPYDWYQKIVSKDERYEVLLRIYEMKQQHVDYLPHDVKVLVNGHEVKLPPLIPASHAGVKPRCQAKPLVITNRIRRREFKDSQNPSFCDVVQVNWYHCDGTKGRPTPAMSYVVAIVRSHTAKEAADRMKKLKRPRKVEVSMKLLKDKANTSSDLGVEQTAQKMSLMCPIMRTPMAMPVRFDGCTHFECFDAENYLTMNFMKPAWNCPICNKRFAFGTLRMDLWFDKLLKDAGVGSREVELNPDGTFKITDKDEDDEDSEDDDIFAAQKRQMAKQQADAIDLDGDDKPAAGGAEAAKSAPKKRKPEENVICLDDSDDDQPTPAKKAAATKSANPGPASTSASKPSSSGSSRQNSKTSSTPAANPTPAPAPLPPATTWKPKSTPISNVSAPPKAGWSQNPFTDRSAPDSQLPPSTISVNTVSKRQHGNQQPVMVPTHSVHQRAPKAVTGYSDFTQGPTQFHGGAGMPVNPGAPVQNGVNFNMRQQNRGPGVSYPNPVQNGNYNQQNYNQNGNYNNQYPKSGRASNRW